MACFPFACQLLASVFVFVINKKVTQLFKDKYPRRLVQRVLKTQQHIHTFNTVMFSSRLEDTLMK